LKTAGPVSCGNSGLKMIRFMTYQEKIVLIFETEPLVQTALGID
jgi:hypothetical protein